MERIRVLRLIGPGVIIVCLGFMFWQSLSYDARDGLYPQGLMLGLLLLCLTVIGGEFKKNSKDIEGIDKSPTGKYKILATIGVTVIYLFICNPIGYYVSTVVFMVVLLLVLGERSWIILAAVPFTTTILIFVVFHQFLNMPLPTGAFF